MPVSRQTKLKKEYKRLKTENLLLTKSQDRLKCPNNDNALSMINPLSTAEFSSIKKRKSYSSHYNKRHSSHARMSTHMEPLVEVKKELF